MQIVFISNFLNHHQIPFCENLRSLCDEFYFVATEEVSNIGFQRATPADYVVNYFEEDKREFCEKIIKEADAVVFGSCPNELIAMRMAEHKLSFLFSERFFKKGTWRRFIPSTRKKVFDRVVKYKNEPMYVLCASAYLAHDLGLLGFPREKCYRWGYFPAVKRYENVDEIFTEKGKNTKVSILWAGRLLDWKHPDCALRMAKRLSDKGFDFEMNIIGSGELENTLNDLLNEYNLSDKVKLLGAKSPDEVRSYMEDSDIYLFTSDRREGWGAVLNEAMNSGCTVIANNSIGASPYLIEHGENGFVYKNEKELYSILEDVINNESLRGKLGYCAYKTITELWNAKTASVRLFEMIKEINRNGTCNLYIDGPCSREKFK